MLATRILGYGAAYQVEVSDPFSGERQQVTIDLAKVKTKDIDYSLLKRDNKYEFTLPQSGKKIKFKLLSHKDEKDVQAEVAALDKLSKGTNPVEVTTRLRKMIVEVEGNTERGFINNWVSNQLLAQDSRALRAHIRDFAPDLDLKFEFTSDITGETEALDIPFGVSFFYPSN
jgi:hypothetical protein